MPDNVSEVEIPPPNHVKATIRNRRQKRNAKYFAARVRRTLRRKGDNPQSSENTAKCQNAGPAADAIPIPKVTTAMQ